MGLERHVPMLGPSHPSRKGEPGLVNCSLFGDLQVILQINACVPPSENIANSAHSRPMLGLFSAYGQASSRQCLTTSGASYVPPTVCLLLSYFARRALFREKTLVRGSIIQSRSPGLREDGGGPGGEAFTC